MKKKRVLPADVYDYLELSALAFGGIGRDQYAVAGSSTRDELARGFGTPCCVWGHAATAGPDPRVNEVAMALEAARINTGVNDDAVEAINKRQGVDVTDRVPFEAYVRQLGIVRGGA